MTYYRFLSLVFAISLMGAMSSDLMAQSAVDDNEGIRSLFYGIHDRIESDSTLGVEVHDEVIEILQVIMAEQPENLHGLGLTSAMEVANRLPTRSGLLGRITEVAYGHDFQNKYDLAHASWVFSLGIIEHARGDMTAATMWFDSTLSFRERGMANQTIGAAAKLLGYIAFEQDNFAAATEKFQLARQVYAVSEVSTAELIDIDCSWASASILSGGDQEACFTVSQNAVDRLDADLNMQKRWTYGYLAYLSHARVLNKMGRLNEAYEYADRAVQFCRSRGDDNSVAYVQLKKAELQVENGQYSEAKAPLLESLELFKTTDHLEHQVEAHGFLELIFEKEGDFAESLAQSRAGRKVDMFLVESMRAEELLEARRDFGIAEAENKALLAEEKTARAELERETAKSSQYTLLAVILCIVMLLGVTFYRLRTRSQRQDELETEVANRTAELAAKTKRLQESNQELERFAYIASHDMKTPLRNVTSFLGLIKRRMPENAKPVLGEYVELALGYARSMHNLVTDVLEFSKLNVDLVELSEPFSLRELCVDLVASRSQDLKETKAQVDVLGNAMLNAPASFVGQIIGNLVDNGLKYNESVIPRISISLYDTEDIVEIIVRDNGIGIAKEYQEKIFNLFQRLHTADQYEGSGLGLASSKKITERLGGQLTLKSEVGKGSIFTLTLPKVYQGDSAKRSLPVSGVDVMKESVG